MVLGLAAKRTKYRFSYWRVGFLFLAIPISAIGTFVIALTATDIIYLVSIYGPLKVGFETMHFVSRSPDLIVSNGDQLSARQAFQHTTVVFALWLGQLIVLFAVLVRWSMENSAHEPCHPLPAHRDT